MEMSSKSGEVGLVKLEKWAAGDTFLCCGEMEQLHKRFILTSREK